MLCRSNAKTCTTHLFIKFPFIKHVWKDMEDNRGKHAIWNEASIEGRLKICFVKSKLKSLRVTPFLVI